MAQSILSQKRISILAEIILLFPLSTLSQYTELLSSFGNYIAIYSTNSLDWEEARNYCQNTLSSDLASITSDDQNNEVNAAITEITGGISGTAGWGWIGFNDILSEGNFVWSDGTINEYTNWEDREPNGNTRENCGMIWQSGTWNDRPCTGYPLNAFVCNRKYNKKTSSSGDFIAIYTSYGLEWEEAREYCKNEFSTDLASIISDIQNNEIKDAFLEIIGDNDVYGSWIGYNDISSEDNFVWSDKTINTYSNWGNNEPNGNTKENCGMMWKTGKWNDRPCKEYPLKSFICDGKSYNYEGIIKKESEYGNFIAVYNENGMEWSEARDYCKNVLLSDLATITTNSENNELNNAIKDVTGGVSGTAGWGWIGFNDILSEGNFVWSDGTINEYKNWGNREPNGDIKENCGMMWQSGSWNDRPCTGYPLNAFGCNLKL